MSALIQRKAALEAQMDARTEELSSLVFDWLEAGDDEKQGLFDERCFLSSQQEADLSKLRELEGRG